MNNIYLLNNMILSYPQWRSMLLSQDDALDRCMHFLMESHTSKDMRLAH